jgi:uncharacterized protein YjiK
MRIASRLASLSAPLLVLGAVACGSADHEIGSGSQDQTMTGSIPLREVSGLAMLDGRFVAIGDHSTTVVTFRLEDGVPVDVETHKPIPKAGKKGSQYEAVAIDGSGNIIVMSEQGDIVVLSDDCEREDATGSLDWDSAAKILGVKLEPNSMGEGLLMLDGGHMLVALEKRPAAIVEFGPKGDAPFGFYPGMRSTTMFEPPSEPLVALKVWPVDDDKNAPDISDLSLGPDGALWALSQEANKLLRFERILKPDESKASVRFSMPLPGEISGAEGLEFVGATPVIGRDRPGASKTNIYVLKAVPELSGATDAP